MQRYQQMSFDMNKKKCFSSFLNLHLFNPVTKTSRKDTVEYMKKTKKKIPQLSDKTSCLADNTGSVQAQASVYECMCVRECMY